MRLAPVRRFAVVFFLPRAPVVLRVVFFAAMWLSSVVKAALSGDGGKTYLICIELQIDKAIFDLPAGVVVVNQHAVQR